MAGGVTASGLSIPDRSRPAAPIPPTGKPSLLKLWSLVRDNPIAAFPAEVYERPVARLTEVAPGPLIVSDPAAIERICVTNSDNYVRGEFQQRRVKKLLGTGLLTSEGETWQAGRHVATPAFSPRLLKPWLDATQDAGQAVAAQWAARDPQGPIDIFDQFLRLSFDIISKYGFSGDFDGLHPEIYRHMDDYFRVQGKVDLATLLRLPRWVPTVGGVRSHRSVTALRRIVTAATEARKAASRSKNPAEPDLLQHYLSAPAPTGADPDVFVRDNILAILLTGHETTAAALAWTVYLLARFPWASDRIADEVEGARLGDTPSPEELNQLTFTRCVMDEALRLYPPAPFFSRAAVAADEICGKPIRPGDEIVISPWVVHRHRLLWEEPDLFAPDRFRNRNRKTIHRGAYIPFGAGPRVCIGQAFATYELLSLIAIFAGRFRFDLADNTRIEPLARITLQPRDGLSVRVRLR